MIQELCNKLNDDIHNDLYHNFYNVSNESRYNQTFTSLDLIEDCQDAIGEFEAIEVNFVEGRSTLFIYGVLQSLFCQQDGLFHLYNCVLDDKMERIDDFFDLFEFNKEIRNVRNDIAGHPTNRKKSEYYFIAKGSNSKYNFTYAGYTPKFRKVEVDLKSFISQQREFALRVLSKVEENIAMKIEEIKAKHNSISLVEILAEMSNCSQLIYRGIRDSERNFQGEWGLSNATDTVGKIKSELNIRYNNILPQGIEDSLRIIEYILNRLNGWFQKGELLNNDDAEIFLDSFNKQEEELLVMLKEIDNKFQK